VAFIDVDMNQTALDQHAGPSLDLFRQVAIIAASAVMVTPLARRLGRSAAGQPMAAPMVVFVLR
jgi:hypothetical protein